MDRGRVTRIKACKQCGTDYEWRSGEMAGRRGTCSDDCRRARDCDRQAVWQARNKRPKQSKPCERCGKETTRPRFCSPRCSQIARDRASGVRPWSERYPVARTVVRSCVVCSAEFTRRKKDGDAALCCSRACGFELIRMRGEVSRKITAEKQLYAKWAKQARGRAKPRAEPKANRCRDCQDEIPKYQHRCAPCRAAAKVAARVRNRRSPSARASKARRKALERGLVAGAERFDPLEILERDGWRCHLCGEKTPKRLRGTYEDKAPELDHVIPLAVGGEHSRRNTACACRKCNIAKADRPLGQLRLIA